jgi:hypothetical protein
MNDLRGDNIIDSRDVIERIEELEGQLVPRFIAGWNMPGYMPDNEPAEFDDPEDAREYIMDTLEQFADEIEEDADEDAQKERDEYIKARGMMLLNDKPNSELETSFNAGRYFFFITEDGETGLDGDELEELKDLKALENECNYGDWSYGETLIKDEYFQEYAEQLAEDIGAISRDNQWPLNCIDWEQAAEELQQDYTQVNFGSDTYWIRS